jgi:hypothetical protein
MIVVWCAITHARHQPGVLPRSCAGMNVRPESSAAAKPYEPVVTSQYSLGTDHPTMPYRSFRQDPVDGAVFVAERNGPLTEQAIADGLAGHTPPGPRTDPPRRPGTMTCRALRVTFEPKSRLMTRAA